MLIKSSLMRYRQPSLSRKTPALTSPTWDCYIRLSSLSISLHFQNPLDCYSWLYFWTVPTQNPCTSHTKFKAAITKTDDEIMNLFVDSFGEYKLQFSTSSSLSEVLATTSSVKTAFGDFILQLLTAASRNHKTEHPNTFHRISLGSPVSQSVERANAFKWQFAKHFFILFFSFYMCFLFNILSLFVSCNFANLH